MMVSRMTTELFHAQLEENIVRAADERRRHQEELKAISRNYEETLGNIERMEDVAGKTTAVPVMLSRMPRKYIRKHSVNAECIATRQDSSETRRRLRRPTFGLSTTIPSRATAITSLRDTEKRGGYLREQKQNSCTQVGPKTRKEE